MLRYFISSAPTFGSYKNPQKWRVEASPYYWWWFALTLNEDYVELCQKLSDGKRYVAKTEDQKAMRLLFKDFGDVRYEGDRYKAFTDWWREKVTATEERGQYLFAEPIIGSKVEVIEDASAASLHADEDSVLLVSIPKSMQRQHVEKALNRIFKKQLPTQKGRGARNPNKSRARYSLIKPLQADALKKSFDLYEMKTNADKSGKRIKNAAMAKVLKIPYKERSKEREAAYADAARDRNISIIVSRHMKKARDLIQSSIQKNWG